MRSLVPLNALRAFEAAGRHSSFLEAAKELSVSPAAISHHIKVLEDFIGTALFVRRNRSIQLTEAGANCLQTLEQSFQQIETTVLRLRNAYADGPLRVRAAPCFASKWLLPRLDSFRKSNPEIDVQVSISSQIFEFRFDEMDILVRLRSGHFRGFVVEPIMREHVVPVCSPALLEAYGPVHTAADLLRFPLIHDDTLRMIETFPTWTAWFRAAGVPQVPDDLAGHRFFESSPLAVEAAIDGSGLCLGRSAIVERDIEAGRLVPIQISPFPNTHNYFIIYSETAVKARKIRRFRDWILRETRRSPMSGLLLEDADHLAAVPLPARRTATTISAKAS